MPALEIRQWRAIEKCQAVEICKRLRDILVATIDLPDPVHQPNFQTETSFAQHDLQAKPNRTDEAGYDCEETYDRERNQIRCHQPLLVNLNVRHDRSAQSFPGTNPYPSTKKGPHAAVALRHAARRHVRACRQKTCDSKRLGRRFADDAQAGAWGG